MLMGETYDACKEMAGWDSSGFDDSQWQPVSVGKLPVKPLIEPHPGPPVVSFVTPMSITEPTPGTYGDDLGQNFAGVVRLKQRGTKPGQAIRRHFGERLNPDGTVYFTNLRTARATDTYICRGDEEDVWSPRFTYHGFQYVEVTGLTAKPTPT